MRAILQRVKSASVSSDGVPCRKIQEGWLVFLGVGNEDSEQDAEYLANKITHLRAFKDQGGKMNLSVLDTRMSVLVVSQFTIMGNCNKGRRPSFEQAAKPEIANELYNKFLQIMRDNTIPTYAGKFQTHMEVSLVNDGPVTLILDSKK